MSGRLRPPQGLKQPWFKTSPQGGWRGPWPPQGNPAGSVAFSPSDVAGLKFWTDYSDATILFQLSNGTTAVTANNDPIGYATDKSTSAKPLTQATAGLRPLYKTNIQNGRSAALFASASTNWMEQSGAADYTQPNHVFIVCKKVNNTGTQKIFDGVTIRSVLDTNGATYEMFSGATGSTGFVDDLAWHQHSCLFNGASGQHRQDQVAGAAIDFGANHLQNLLVGIDTGKAVQAADMYVGEILVYNAALTGANLTNVENFLKSRWATP